VTKTCLAPTEVAQSRVQTSHPPTKKGKVEVNHLDRVLQKVESLSLALMKTSLSSSTTTMQSLTRNTIMAWLTFQVSLR